MSALHALARVMLHASVALAPKHRADWTRAMRAEFEAIDAGGQALDWALGCLATAAGWRLRADWGYLLSFAAMIGTSIWFGDHWQEYKQPGTTWNLFAWDNSMLILGLALPVCVAVAVRRRPTTNAGWLLVIAAAIALSAWVHGHWRDVMHTAAGDSLPALAVAMLVLKLALPGSIAAAICWRLKTDTAYVTALVGLIVVAHWLDRGMWNAFPDRSTEQFFALAHASPYVSLALPCLLLCVYRPDRTLLTLFVALLINGSMASSITTVLPMLADPFKVAGNHPEVPNAVMAGLFSWAMFGPGLVGAATGWTLGTLGRRLRRA
jgi:hypothetical protein